ncbi:MAG: LCP family protein [Chloroflexota bacterium]|nr:LCP family protein [Chloroflexota bacterium]
MEEKQDTQTQDNSKSTNWLRMALLAAFLIAAGLTAFLTYRLVRDFVITWEITSLPGISVREATPIAEESGVVRDSQTPLQAPTGPTPPPWDGAGRITMLLMGLDYRDWISGEGPPRTDTMILITIDPINRTAGMLSVPRDLWVNIPGFDYGRINSAYQLGEAFQLPGGGPGLAIETVEELLGVPVDYYALIDFYAFERFIDEIDGIKINIPEPITVDPLGDNNAKKLKPGIQTLSGELALAYARARKTEGGDFDRAQRQQQVIMAIRDRILSFDMLPTLIAKSGVLYNELSAGVHTNLNLDQAIKLSWLASQIPEENIKRGIIGPPDQVSLAVSPDGEQQVLKPITENIRLLRDEIFTESGPTSPMAEGMNPEEKVRAEAARTAVLNGSYTPGLAARTSEYLLSLGLNVTVTDNAQNVATYSEITFYNGKPYTVKYLVELMEISPFRIRYFNDPTSEVDITIILGDDWAAKNPMP